MLIFISDLHFKDGTSGPNLSPDAFRIFNQRLREQAYRASWRGSNSNYRPIERLDLVLLGDIFDLIRSAKWVSDEGQPAARPWGDPNSPAFIHKVDEIVTGILDRNQETFDILRSLSQGNTITLPPAKRDGTPDWQAAEQQPIQVGVHYMVGNHDWILYLPGEPYQEIRQKVVQALGLSNSAGPFPYIPSESPSLAAILEYHHVFARHGDFYDPLNYDPERGRAASALGDLLSVELLDRFPFDVQEQLGDEVPLQFSEGLKEMANVRPALVTPLWVGHLIDTHTASTAQADKIKTIWNDLAKRFLESDHLRPYDRRFKFDTVNALEAALILAKELPIDAINRILGWMGERLWGNKTSFAKHALSEDAFLNKTAKHIVFGHTHHHEVIPLDSNLVGGQVYDQIYMNTGTWHAYHDLTLSTSSRYKFMSLNVMSYLTFYQGDERNRHAFETWSGSLAMPPIPARMDRTLAKEA